MQCHTYNDYVTPTRHTVTHAHGVTPPPPPAPCSRLRGFEFALVTTMATLTTPPVKVGLVGAGTVGAALRHFLHGRAHGGGGGVAVRAFDVVPERSDTASVHELAAWADVVILALPTNAVVQPPPPPPSPSPTAYDLCAVHRTLEALDAAGFHAKPVLLRSTVAPTTTQSLFERFAGRMHVFHLPEMLSSATAAVDVDERASAATGMARLTLGVCAGVPAASIDRCVRYLRAMFPRQPQVAFASAVETESAKLFANAFFAAKLTLFEDFRRVCEHTGAHYPTVRQLMLDSGWIHHMHTHPSTNAAASPSGSMRVAGACLPKDVRAAAHVVAALPPGRRPSGILRATVAALDRPS